MTALGKRFYAVVIYFTAPLTALPYSAAVGSAGFRSERETMRCEGCDARHK